MIVTIIAALVALVIGGAAGYFIFRYVIKGKYNEMIEAANKEAEVVKEKKLLEVKEKFLNVTAKSEIGTVNENISIALKGKDLSIAFNAKYLSEYLKILSDEKVRVFLNSPIAPCILRPQESEDYLYLVLPVRINS